MKRLALLVSLIGMSVLFLILHFSLPLKISSSKEIDSLSQNQKVSVFGKIILDYQSQSLRILKLENGISLYCNCENIPDLKGKNITAVGVIDTFEYNKVKVLKLTLKN